MGWVVTCQIPTWNIAIFQIKLNAKLIKSGHHTQNNDVIYFKQKCCRDVFDLLQFPLCLFITNYYKF